MKEIFKPIKGYEGLYEVSNLGNVKSVCKNGKGIGIGKSRKEVILKPIMNKGYLRVNLSKNGVIKHFSIHRLVAEAFLPNPNNYPEVNHKDENKTNNTIDNLEWCDSKYNNNYGTRNERINKTRSKSVRQYFLNGTLFATYKSIGEACRSTNINTGNISACCNKKQKTAGGFIWKFVD